MSFCSPFHVDFENTNIKTKFSQLLPTISEKRVFLWKNAFFEHFKNPFLRISQN